MALQNRDLESKMKAKLEDLRLAEQHEAIWNSYCDNCREPLDGREVWIEVYARHEEDDDPTKTYYCAKCISVNHKRGKDAPGGV